MNFWRNKWTYLILFGLQVKDEAKALLVKLAKAKEPDPEGTTGNSQTVSTDMEVSNEETTPASVLQDKWADWVINYF